MLGGDIALEIRIGSKARRHGIGTPRALQDAGAVVGGVLYGAG